MKRRVEFLDIIKIHKKIRQMMDIAHSHLEGSDGPYYSQVIGRMIALSFLRHWIEEEFMLGPLNTADAVKTTNKKEKKMSEVKERGVKGFEGLIGETVTLFCLNYFYNGKLVGVTDDCVLLEEPKIIYDTGDWAKKEWEDIQSLEMAELYIRKGAIESFGKTK